MTIGIVGTRSRDSEQDFEIVEIRFLDLYTEGDRICSGLCPKCHTKLNLSDLYKEIKV